MRRNPEKAADYARRHGIPRWYTDPVELLSDPEVNAIYIATPPSTHATYAIMAMKAGIPVYVEKPLAADYEDCCRIMRMSEVTGVPCFVAYYRRYLPYFQKVFQMVREGAVGKVLNVQIRFAVPPRDLDYNSHDLPWRVQADIAGGGYFYDLAPHQIDLLQQMFGPIVEGRGHRKRMLPLRRRTSRKRLLVLRDRRNRTRGQHRHHRRRRKTQILRVHLRPHHPLQHIRTPILPTRKSTTRPTTTHPERRGTSPGQSRMHMRLRERNTRKLGYG